jgi:cation diffusion facilitator family transporter
MQQPTAKIRAARLSIVTATVLAVVKLATGLMTGSMAVLSSAIDSTLDILMSGVNFLAIRQAEQPADESHPFGHGKYETLATLIQSLVIAASGLWIVFEAVRRLLQGVALTRLGEGIGVLVFSTVVSIFISRYLRRVARQTDSSALEADSLHFAMDVYTNAALVVGLVVIKFVAIPWLDPVLSILVALYILFEAVRLVRHGLRDVLDEELPPAVREEVERLIQAHEGDIGGFHNLRTRRAGSQKIMDFHLTVCKHLSVAEAHAIADHLEKRIEEDIRGSDVTIHIEPCRSAECPGRENCPAEKARLGRAGDDRSPHSASPPT